MEIGGIVIETIPQTVDSPHGPVRFNAVAGTAGGGRLQRDLTVRGDAHPVLNTRGKPQDLSKGREWNGSFAEAPPRPAAEERIRQSAIRRGGRELHNRRARLTLDG